MKRFMLFAVFAGLSAVCRSQGIGTIATVSIIDRDTSTVLVPHYYRGEYWVAGRPGARYAVEIRNRSGERIQAVTSVDGVNVLSGETASWDQTGYIFNAGQDYEITGWRKSDREVAAFNFTDSSDSYAERTGRPANVGVVGVALFREREKPPVDVPPAIARSSPPFSASSDAFDAAAARAFTPLPAAAPPVVMGGASASPVPAQLSPKLGTGHGEREYSFVVHVNFQRRQEQPNEIIRIRYDSVENLVAMGIIRRPSPVPSAANPFPASPEQHYVPDPPG